MSCCTVANVSSFTLFDGSSFLWLIGPGQMFVWKVRQIILFSWSTINKILILTPVSLSLPPTHEYSHLYRIDSVPVTTFHYLDLPLSPNWTITATESILFPQGIISSRPLLGRSYSLLPDTFRHCYIASRKAWCYGFSPCPYCCQREFPKTQASSSQKSSGTLRYQQNEDKAS